MARSPTTYWDYIKVEQLLSLQGGLEANDHDLANDEVMFITVHQIDELWFKLILRELVSVRDLFAQPLVPEQSLSSAVRGIRRVAVLMRHLAEHFSLMETMTTRDYLAFRDKLSPASGFQSAQLREIEIIMGLPDSQRIALGHESSYLDALANHDGTPSPALLRVKARLEDRPSLREAVHAWLERTPIRGSMPSDPNDAEIVRGFVEDYLAAQSREIDEIEKDAVASARNADDRVRLGKRFAAERSSARAFLTAEDQPPEIRDRTMRLRAALVFIESYRELPLLAWPREVVDGIVALEQTMLIFRQRHARMVERVIGRRTGTGGSAGVDYLDQTALRYRVFADIWAVRTLLLRRDALPALPNPEFYDFAGGR
jgi:tryptophan 2,3-dioxygenase